MLKGNLIVNKDGRKLNYDILAIDYPSEFKMYIQSSNYRAINYMSFSNYEQEDVYALWERRVDIKMAKVVVETTNYKGENGKNVKAPINPELFCKFGALLRYCKNNCLQKYAEGYLGVTCTSGEFEAVPCQLYHIPHPETKQVFADVALELGVITGISIKTDEFELYLKTDDSEPIVFRTLKNGAEKGFAFTKEYLGFSPWVQPVIDVVDDNDMFTCIEDIVAAHPDKELSWLLGKDYRIVSDDDLDEVCNYIINHDGYVYYDTETSGLNITFKSRFGQGDQLVGVVLSVKYGESFFFPTQMKSIPNLCGGDHWYFMEHYMRPILEGKNLVAHNAPFDWKVAHIYDINANIVHDTLALIRLTLGAEKPNWQLGLKYNTKVILKRDSLELSDLLVNDAWGENDIAFWDLPYHSVRLYACADTDNTNGLLQWAEQNDILAKYGATKVYEIEMAFSFAVAYQEFYGHHLDISDLTSLKRVTDEELEAYRKQLFEIAGHEFNPNSPPQLQQIMYTELGIPEQISRKTGRVTTDKETVKKLAEIRDLDDNVKYPFCDVLLKYREQEGVRKIVDKFPEHMTQDGYIFSEVRQFGTTTGRVSITNPNYQSYSDSIKKNVVPRPGYYMFDTDYSSVEYRVLGNMVGNKRIMENFKDPDFDYHAYQAAHMYGVPYSAVTKKLRKAAKGINFGLPYGMGDESLGVRVFGEASTENTRKAAALRAAYFKGQEDIRDWFEYHRNRGVNEGYTETFFGRRRYYNRAEFSVGAIRRQAGNQVIQGTAADIYKLAVGRLFKRICKEGWLGKVLLDGFIHDELLIEVSNDIDPCMWLKVAREEFEVKISNEDGTPWSPLYMGCGFGTSWYEAKSVELPIKLQWELVEKYGDTGHPYWSGVGREFCDKIPDILRDFEVRDIRSQLLDVDSQGKEIKPTLNNQLIDCIKYDVKHYTQGLCDFIQSDDFMLCQEMGMKAFLDLHEKAVEAFLDEHFHIQKLVRNDSGVVLTELSSVKDTQELIDLFCKLHDVDRSLVNILNIEEHVETNANNLGDISSFFEDDEEDEGAKQRNIDLRIDTFGMYLDTDAREIRLLKIPNPVYMNFIKQYTNQEARGYRILFKDNENQKYWTTQSYLESDKINVIQQMYLQYFKSIGR